VNGLVRANDVLGDAGSEPGAQCLGRGEGVVWVAPGPPALLPRAAPYISEASPARAADLTPATAVPSADG